VHASGQHVFSSPIFSIYFSLSIVNVVVVVAEACIAAETLEGRFAIGIRRLFLSHFLIVVLFKKFE